MPGAPFRGRVDAFHKDLLMSSTTHLLQRHNIRLEILEQDLKRLPGQGAFLAVCNQVLEGYSALLLMELLAQGGRTGRVMSWRPPPEEGLPADGWLYPGSPTQQGFHKQFYKTLKKESARGHALGLVLHFRGLGLREGTGRGFFNRLAKALLKAGVPIVPVRFQVDGPALFRSRLGPQLARLSGQELVVRARIGSPIPPEEQQKFSPRVFRRYLQSKIFSLGTPLEVRSFFQWPRLRNQAEPEPLAPPADPQKIREEIRHLTFENLLATQGKFDILLAAAPQIPTALLEIGRLRELTFRAVGEGTGKARDNDEYDLYYRQLLIWDREAERIVGGYRMGLGDEIFERYGVEGFYMHSLFKIKPPFYPIMRQAVELGRSYIIPDYQKQRLPLFLLWKGILFFLLKNPRYRYLYGPVSISKYYSNISKSLIIAFIRKHYFNEELARYLKPRKAFTFRGENKVDIELLTDSLDQGMKALDNLVEDIEPQHFRIPVLIRQYLRLNARFIGFNVDPNFSDCLDGFILLDLHDVPIEMLEALKREA